MLPSHVGNIVLQARDLAVLRGLFECRIMTRQHIATLNFDGQKEMAKKRLQKLKGSGYIAERPRKQFEPGVLYLARGGFLLLKSKGILDLYPKFGIPSLLRRAHVSELTLRHELSVIDLKVAFHVAATSNSNFSIAEFTAWPRLNQFEALGTVIKPDAFIRLHRQSSSGPIQEQCFYVELDRSTESLDILLARARCYLVHQRSTRHGIGERKHRSFRVLYVFSSQERCDNISQRLRVGTPPILSLIWATTLDDAKRDPLGAIWKRPIDYQHGAPPVTNSLVGTLDESVNASAM